MRSIAVVFAVAALAAGSAAHAQLPQIPGPVPLGSPIPRILPPPPPPVALPAPPPPAAPPQAVPNQPVAVRSVAVQGATVYPASSLLALAQGLVGPATPLARIDAARLAIVERYRADGYVLTSVTADVDAAGNLRFVVTEGSIAAVKLDGDIGPAAAQVQRFLDRLTETKPIDQVTLERYLLLAQDVPGVTLNATLEPSPDTPGALTLLAHVSRKPVSGLLTADNRADPYEGPVEGLALLDFNSFTPFGERTELSLYHTFPNSQTFGQGSFEAFAGASGLKLKAYAGSGPATPTGTFAAIGYTGTTTVFGAQASYPLIRARQQTLNLAANFDGIEETDRAGTGINAAGGLSTYDSLRVLRVSADEAISDLLLGDERPAINAATLRLSQGLAILGASSQGATNAPRLNEQPDFFKANFDISRTQTLFRPWTDASVALMGVLAGQVTPDVLPPVEEFYLGGARLTRGYYSGQVIGDNALAATAELQLNTPLPASSIGVPWAVGAQFYLFYDWGETWQNQNIEPNRRIASTGGGARLNITERIEVDLEGVARLNRYPNGSGPGVSALNGGAVYWRALVRF